MTTHPKFFLFDAGVYRTIRPRGPLDSPEEIDGAALETLVYQELRAHIAYRALDLDLTRGVRPRARRSTSSPTAATGCSRSR